MKNYLNKNCSSVMCFPFLQCIPTKNQVCGYRFRDDDNETFRFFVRNLDVDVPFRCLLLNFACVQPIQDSISRIFKCGRFLDKTQEKLVLNILFLLDDLKEINLCFFKNLR